MRRAQAGDHDAFATLVRDSLGRLYGTARLILRDPGPGARTRSRTRSSRVARHPWPARSRRLDAWLLRILVRSCHDTARGKRTGTVTEIAFEPPRDRRPRRPDRRRIADRDEIERAFAASDPGPADDPDPGLLRGPEPAGRLGRARRPARDGQSRASSTRSTPCEPRWPTTTHDHPGLGWADRMTTADATRRERRPRRPTALVDDLDVDAQPDRPVRDGRRFDPGGAATSTAPGPGQATGARPSRPTGGSVDGGSASASPWRWS